MWITLEKQTVDKIYDYSLSDLNLPVADRSYEEINW